MIPKAFFHRSDSSGSWKSRTSSSDSTSTATTPRSSVESHNHQDLTCHDLTPQPQIAPILSLPIELVQQIASYLESGSAAPFCLSSRYIYYALGSAYLSNYIDGSKSRFEKRRTIEAVVERAFPGHWFCAWCDKFHAWDPSTTSPTSACEAKPRDCADFNSYLSTSSHGKADYVLRYHHVRLALNHSLWGPAHGLPLSTFTHSQNSMAKLHRTPVPTKLDISARIVEESFILHTTFAIILPAPLSTRRTVLTHLWPLLPPILSGHRDSENGHTGLMAALDNVLRRGWKYPFTQSCGCCKTDWSVASHFFPHATGGQVRLVVQSWRDLGGGRNPFESAWRAHGGFVRGLERAGVEASRVSGVQAGDVRRAFECENGGEGTGVGVRRMERGASPVRMRIYQSFMRMGRNVDEDGEGDGEVRRSRARPRTWRTRSEIEEMERRDEEERTYVARQVAEELVRLDAVRTVRR